MSAIAQSAEAQLYAMRDPLARVELAASRLLRWAPEHGGRELAHVILDAVADLDQKLYESIGALQPLRRDARGTDDCGAVLIEVTEEFRPIIAARARTLGRFVTPTSAVRGEASFARRAAIQLLRAGSTWVGCSGRLHLSLTDEPQRYGISIAAERSHHARTPGPEAFDSVRRFALAEAAELVVTISEPGSAHATATLWRHVTEALA